ncbi:hypothetical protein CDQ84_18525 [Clostridium thermosuccinogenes]|uniref:Tc1-like transposase DDE domain-containing protein n=1 Tax=Clostridium thermosuccinogenes TaxID=84032 RepID=A0A2K2F7C0_9CLOT|nr:hypothetical protein CDO33_17130 [Pseudoclostridium thermosuccinogenes]PNT91885.1 hypothetical protein CDQ85_18450 [Pseudoclostridium thermosuccinogenes]PNT94672.1 hypothetical protein CDQ84_18525 [Pseudoclostridium thermosuccinogenes]
MSLYDDYEIWYLDEVHFYRSTTICRMWAKRGCQPKVKSAPTQEKVAFIGYINPLTGELITNECNKFNYETVIESVKSFTEYVPSDKKILIVLDNAPWHKKAVRLLRASNEYPRLEFILFKAPNVKLRTLCS